MYFAQVVEPFHKIRKATAHRFASTTEGYKLLIFRVEIGAPGTPNAGRPLWRLHAEGHYAYGYGRDECKRMCMAKAMDGVPFMKTASPGKLVLMSEATRLTGIGAPGALDALTEAVLETDPWSAAVQNYVKPKPVKEPKPEPEPKAMPSREQIARSKLAKAEAKVDEWNRRAAHAAEMAKKWGRKANEHRRRVNALAATAVGV